MEPLLLKAGEVAKLLGLGRSKVFAMLAVGELPVIRIRGRWRVGRDEAPNTRGGGSADAGDG